MQGLRRKLVVALTVSVMAIGLASCGFDIKNVPLPGGVDVGDNPNEYQILFDDVLDLVPQSLVKFDGANVGQVTRIQVPTDGWQALVTIKVRDSINLSDESRAMVRQTNLLGEKFVALEDPGAGTAPPQNPDVPISGPERTGTTTDIEQLLGALSLVLNGGGIAQLEPIIHSLNEALGSQPDTVRALIESADGLVTTLNGQRDAIITAIEGVSTLSARANQQTEQIERILAELPKGVQVLEDQRPQFVELLSKLDELGEVGVSILGTARQEIINDLKALRPILTELAGSADDLITAAPLMFTHPFPDQLLPGVVGDSTNLFLTVDLRILNSLEALGVGQGDPKYRAPAQYAPRVNPNNPYYNGNGPRWGWPTISLLPPAPNSRPGPNTPPSGGTYPMNPGMQQRQEQAEREDRGRVPSAANANPASAPAGDPNFLANALGMIGVGQ